MTGNNELTSKSLMVEGLLSGSRTVTDKIHSESPTYEDPESQNSSGFLEHQFSRLFKHFE